MINAVKDTMKQIENLSATLGYPILPSDYYVEDLGCPHTIPKRLPEGCIAVYFFFEGDVALKIGKANAKSKARYTYQHYEINTTKSSLAKSLMNDPNRHFNDAADVKNWMLNNLQRINVLIKEDKGKAATELVEAIMHYKFRPTYEGAL